MSALTSTAARSISLRDRLAHLSFNDACKLLGPGGRQLLMRGGNLELVSPDDIRIDDHGVRARWEAGRNGAVSRLLVDPAVRGGLRVECNVCDRACEHVGGLLSILLEQKSELGLAMPPPDATWAVSEAELVRQALEERAKRADSERMKVRSMTPSTPWTDYVVNSEASGKTYRVALRGEARGVSYCSCPDFRVNTLGTCKHIMKVLARTKAFPKSVRDRPYRRKRVTVHLRYTEGVTLAVALPDRLTEDVRKVVHPLTTRTIDAADLIRRLAKLEALGQAFFITPDAEEYIERHLVSARMSKLVAEVRSSPDKHPLRTSLLKEPLLPYQLDGVAFAVGAGRAIVADEMGLGKTIQGVGVAELLAREVGVRKVLVVCPASLKSQWRSEIERFSGRSTELVVGASKVRARAYDSDTFFTICNYEQVLKDILHIEKRRWDLIILDEGQRIKNWESKTSRVIKGLSSRFALVLTGTPLENRLDDLHSVVAFVDPHRLGPAFRFLHRHQRRDADGALLGFKNLNDLRERLRPILLRRTRESVRLELPPRTVEIVRIPPTDEQKSLHDAHMQTVAQIVTKRFLTEMDLLRLRTALLMCRMAADSTFLVDKQKPGWSSKLERLGELFDGIAAEPDRKVLVFSEWTTMLDLIEPLLQARGLSFVRLDGSVAQKKRQTLVAQFQRDPHQRVFLTTNAGSTGLNLQAANTVINVDLPWNPAILEQRIARAHRMGQTAPVSVFVLVTEATLEENLLTTLSSKQELAMAALDPDSQVLDVDVRSQAEDIKAKLEVLLGNKPVVPVDETVKTMVTRGLAADRLAETGAAFLRAALDLLGDAEGDARMGGRQRLVDAVRTGFDVKLMADDAGRPRLSLAMPSRETLVSLLEGGLALLAKGAATHSSRSPGGGPDAPRDRTGRHPYRDGRSARRS
jgi:superfamily II DNA or RNA helicase